MAYNLFSPGLVSYWEKWFLRPTSQGIIQQASLGQPGLEAGHGSLSSIIPLDVCRMLATVKRKKKQSLNFPPWKFPSGSFNVSICEGNTCSPQTCSLLSVALLSDVLVIQEGLFSCILSVIVNLSTLILHFSLLRPKTWKCLVHEARNCAKRKSGD